jgi:predicted deacetylase
MTSSFFSGPSYLVRFDDICPTMDWAAWEEIEAALVEQGVSPILAVVPDNRDPRLMVAPAAANFWERVRGWQARGWTIGLHGLHHTYVNREAGMLQMNARSEFAGLSFEEQFAKLSLGLEVFAREGVRADVWIAPAHSFDGTTVLALKALGLHTISDGMAFSPYRDAGGTIWVPQQFARMRPVPWGIWTFCYHINGITPKALAEFKQSLKRLSLRMISLPEAEALGDRRKSFPDRFVALARRVVSGARRLHAH